MGITYFDERKKSGKEYFFQRKNEEIDLDIEIPQINLQKEEIIKDDIENKDNMIGKKLTEDFKKESDINKDINEEKKKEISERQFNLWKNIIKEENEDKNENISLIKKNYQLRGLSTDEIKKEINKTKILEDMSTLCTIMKEEILNQKNTSPEKFISEEEIIENKDNNEQLYHLGIFTKVLQNNGIITAIERNNTEESKNNAETNLQFLINGMSNKNKYNLHFNLGKERNYALLNNENERKLFHEKLRRKISNLYNINEEDIILTFPRKGCYQIPAFNKSEIEIDENENSELNKIKKIEKELILNGCKLNISMINERGNNKDGGWAPFGEKRGKEEYIPPHDWIGFGLKVLDVYENNNWIGMNNTEDEWVVAYHGVARSQSPKNVIKIAGNIISGGFKPSTSGKCIYDADIRGHQKTCWLGIYCTPNINYAESYAGITEFNNEKYKCALMLRVNRNKIRQSKTYQKEYILEPTTNEIRPYRILLKKIVNNR